MEYSRQYSQDLCAGCQAALQDNTLRIGVCGQPRPGSPPRWRWHHISWCATIAVGLVWRPWSDPASRKWMDAHLEGGRSAAAAIPSRRRPALHVLQPAAKPLDRRAYARGAELEECVPRRPGSHPRANVHPQLMPGSVAPARQSSFPERYSCSRYTSCLYKSCRIAFSCGERGVRGSPPHAHTLLWWSSRRREHRHVGGRYFRMAGSGSL